MPHSGEADTASGNQDDRGYAKELMNAKAETQFFGAVERRLLRATAIMFAILAMIGIVAGMIWILGVAVAFFYNLIMPLCVTGILVLVLHPVLNHLERWKWLNRTAATSIVVLLFMGAIAGFIVMVVPTLLREIVLFSELVPAMLAGWRDFMFTNFPAFTRIIMESAQDSEFKVVMPGLESTRRSVQSIGGVLAGLSFVPLLLFFGLLSGRHLNNHLAETLTVFSDRAQKKITYFVEVFLAQVTGFFQGQLVIAMIMGAMFALGFTLIDLKGGIMIGLILGLLNIVPFLGTLIGLLIVLPWAYMQPFGGIQLVGLSLLVFTIVQLVESWILTPKIMANRSGLHPALVVISVFFWGIAFGGITGMILAVALTAFLVAVWSQAKVGLTRSMTSDYDADRIETSTGTEQASTIRESREQPASTASRIISTEQIKS
ncbi:AI-2E family transporter [Wenzhouxiangella sp. AB-CW3]|uniref:AI-2E family transporter n=1 Tax=Wenzhouxiangella sp. AB-CW3 TaxID=2771012 RepID=UPI00168B9C1E|nr:AI-2E family transporter [Wenzhouxiangella sp. AB-CW3]QOC22044.1 AI-2E family transporter [Wenzhouxiangella sp. AB-CW3]